MVHPFAALKALKNPGLLVDLVRRDQNRHWLADYVFGGIPKHSLRTFVPTRDDALQGLGNDRIVGRIDHRRKMRAKFRGELLGGNVPGETTAVNESAIFKQDV